MERYAVATRGLLIALSICSLLYCDFCLQLVSTIKVEIRGGGAQEIRVADNGKGMSPEDAGIAFLRHATSKISKEEDLEAIGTMGFRGEALAVLRECAAVYTRGRTGHRADSCVPAELQPAGLHPAEPHPEPLLRPEWIRGMEERIMEETELRALTHAVHSAVLSHRGEIVFAAEDIGRHNAIDKAAGFALRNGIPLGECLLYTTGRMPSDMVMKAVRAGIPALVSGKGPTAEGLRIAKQYGLLVAGNVRNGRICFY